MGTKLNTLAWHWLIKNNIEWLDKQPRSLEQEHIKTILSTLLERNVVEYEDFANNAICIGRRVRVKAKASFEYDDKQNKELYRDECDLMAYIVGKTRKAVGFYKRPEYYYMSLDGEDYDPGYFQARKYYPVYECKTSLTSKPFYVLLEDIDA